MAGFTYRISKSHLQDSLGQEFHAHEISPIFRAFGLLEQQSSRRSNGVRTIKLRLKYLNEIKFLRKDNIWLKVKINI